MGALSKTEFCPFIALFLKFCPHILNGRDAKLTLTFPFLSRWIEYMYEHDNQKYYFFKEKWMNTTYKVKNPNFCMVYHKKLKIIHNNWNKYTPRKKKKNLITSILHIYYNYCYIEKYFSSFSRFVICNNIFVLKKWIYSWRDGVQTLNFHKCNVSYLKFYKYSKRFLDKLGVDSETHTYNLWLWKKYVLCVS